MKIVVAIFIFIHGFAHIVGFLAYWKILKNPDMPYKTTIIFDKVNVGDVGMRILGVIWLLTAVAFAYVGYGVLTQMPLWLSYAWIVTAISMALCISGWPETKFGVIANVLISLFLVLEKNLHWLQ
ncbi:hypothetical protein ACFLT9_00560 [Acidobacteriota bacterium]